MHIFRRVLSLILGAPLRRDLPKFSSPVVVLPLFLAACTSAGKVASDATTGVLDAAPAMSSSATPEAGAAASTKVETAVDGCVHVHYDPNRAGTSTVEGTVRKEERKARGSTTVLLFVVLAKPVCVVGSPQVKETKEIQLTTPPMNGPTPDAIEKLVGKKVRFTGAGYTGQFSSDVRPVLLSVAAFTEISGSTP